jgi:hypothetical protein
MRVLISTLRLLEFLEGGGHFWVYMQYAHALRKLGCELHLLDSFAWSAAMPDEHRLGEFRDRLARHGFGDRVIVATDGPASDGARNGSRFLGMSESEARDRLSEMDLLLNFNYGLGQDLVSAPRRSALVDIDPGLLQYWVRRGYITVAAHDQYFTTGETVGTPRSPIPECGLDWFGIRPAVALDLWPCTCDGAAGAFTGISSWWSERDYVGEPGDYYDNTKRTAFQPFVDLPRRTDQPLELALFLADTDGPDRTTLERHGWRVRHSREVAGSPEAYRTYIQGSRGEFGWAKASCIRWQNAWVSDRSLCYLASGKPVVVQHTGRSSVLPNGEGMFRFRTVAEAARALEVINADYQRQSRFARKLAEEEFDADEIVGRMLEVTL